MPASDMSVACSIKNSKSTCSLLDDMATFVGSIDQGTSSSRFILFNASGEIVASHQVEFPQYYPRSGENWVEHDPMEILESVTTCIDRVFEEHADTISVSDVLSVGITNQRETTVVWDRETGEPLHRALVWLDTRAKDQCDELCEQYPEGKDVFRPHCGLPINPYFSAMKLKWLIDNVDAVREAVEAERCMFGTVESWLVFKLTGHALHVTDVTNASRTMLMDINTCKWSDYMCETLGIPKHVLPEIRPNVDDFGKFQAGALAGVPINACIGDQQSAMLGQLCTNKGDVKNTYGTGCFMLMNTGTDKPVQSTHGLLTTVCFQLGPDEPVNYAIEGAVAVAGVAVKWLRDNLKLIASAEETTELASSVPDSAGVYFVPAFSGLFAPYWRSDARGVICGLTLEATRAHIVRATLESVCHRSREVVAAMVADSDAEINHLKVDGGMVVNDVLLQIQADILNTRVLRPQMVETTAFGAAIAAGLRAGLWSSVEDVRKRAVNGLTEFTPNLDESVRQDRIAGWNKAVERALGWAPSASSANS